jgi:predicted lipoprotein with Yx(FWY)xxD motif
MKRLILPVLVAATLLAACGGSSSPKNASSTTSTGGGGAYSSGAATPAPKAAAASGSAATVETRTGGPGRFLVDAKGRTLYLWVADKGSKSTCSGACAQAWPPLTTTGKPRAGKGAKASLLGTTKRSDGTLEVTYAGHPLYYFAGDARPGQTSGQGSTGFGAAWWVVAANGKAITHGGS